MLCGEVYLIMVIDTVCEYCLSGTPNICIQDYMLPH